ncbi:hypothetical protein Bca52824_051772 [Brassica carinata]|uniref:Uncharacterized protein n=1 Tax=Brassica carinata TaxID=52824 RepID=A0A8X7R2P8_BRACI|nr:hypothetical protein Bca52824_051772 [Brassica carinata]
MSSSSPEDDEDCVVGVKFLGPQLSFCRPAESKPEGTSVKLENPCFHSSRLMFSKKDKVFRILGCEDHLIASCGLFSKREHFMVRWCKKTIEMTKSGVATMRRKALKLFRLDEEEEGNDMLQSARLNGIFWIRSARASTWWSHQLVRLSWLSSTRRRELLKKVSLE